MKISTSNIINVRVFQDIIVANATISEHNTRLNKLLSVHKTSSVPVKHGHMATLARCSTEMFLI